MCKFAGVQVRDQVGHLRAFEARPREALGFHLIQHVRSVAPQHRDHRRAGEFARPERAVGALRWKRRCDRPCSSYSRRRGCPAPGRPASSKNFAAQKELTRPASRPGSSGAERRSGRRHARRVIPHLGRDLGERFALNAHGQSLPLSDGTWRNRRIEIWRPPAPAAVMRNTPICFARAGQVAKINQHVGEVLRAELRNGDALRRSGGQHLGAMVPHGVSERNGIGEASPLAHGARLGCGSPRNRGPRTLACRVPRRPVVQKNARRIRMPSDPARPAGRVRRR